MIIIMPLNRKNGFYDEFRSQIITYFYWTFSRKILVFGCFIIIIFSWFLKVDSSFNFVNSHAAYQLSKCEDEFTGKFF